MNEVVPTPDAIEGARRAVEDDVILIGDGNLSSRQLQLAIMLGGWGVVQTALLLGLVVTESSNDASWALLLLLFVCAVATLAATCAFLFYVALKQGSNDD